MQFVLPALILQQHAPPFHGDKLGHPPTLQDVAQVDDIIERLLDVRNGRPGRQVQLGENEIRLLCLTAKEIFMSQPNLLELEAPIKICGEWAHTSPCLQE